MHILLYGPGDLGERISYLLAARLGARDRLTIAGRSRERVQEIVHMARMTSHGLGLGARMAAWCMSDPTAFEAQQWIASEHPDAIIFTATRRTWWKLTGWPQPWAGFVQRAGFGLWLPLQTDLLMQWADLFKHQQPQPWLLVAPHPDVTAPLLKQRGLDAVLGFGNVDELVMAMESTGSAEVRMAAHHSVESALFGSRPLPPYYLSVQKDAQWVREDLGLPFEWPSGTRSHQWTAVSCIRTLEALFSDTSRVLHIPGPLGLPGGYPTRLGKGQVEVLAPPGATLEAAITINQEAARHDGIDRIEAGRVWFTAACQEAQEALFGRHWASLGEPEEWRQAADIMQERLEEMAIS